MTVVTDIALPLVLIFAPALITFLYVKNQVGLMCGFTIGIAIGIGANVLPMWTVIIAVLGLVSLFFINKRNESEG